MEPVFAEHPALSAGRKVALEQAFRTVADTDLGAGPKYGPRVMARLAQIISARAYGRPLMELCHLVRVAERAGGRHGWTGFFFGLQVARAAAFRGVLEEASRRGRGLGSGIGLEDGGVTLNYEDRPFTISYGRMPFLAALLEFLVTELGYQTVDEALASLRDAPFRLDACGPTSNALSRAMYDRLKTHLPSAHAQRVFQRLVQHLARRSGGYFRLEDVDDAFVLSYWMADDVTASESGPVAGRLAETNDSADEDIRTYQRAAEQVARFRSAFEAGLLCRELDRAATIGSDRAAGEVDPDAVLDALERHEAPIEPMDRLSEEPADRVKFLNRRETEQMEVLRVLGAQAIHLPVSALRIDVFGALQRRIVQAVRNRETPDTLARLIGCEDAPSYADRLEGWTHLAHHLERIGLAALSALVEGKRPEAILEVVERAPGFDPVRLREVTDPARDTEDGDKIVSLRPNGLSEGAVAAMVGALTQEEIAGADAVEVLARARTALRGLSRQGFVHGVRTQPEILEAMAAGAPLLRRLHRDLSRLRSAARSGLGPDPEAAFSEDRVCFARRFETFYGSKAREIVE